MSATDPDVLVLTGADMDEDHVIDTMTKVFQFMEVPGESQFLKKQMGDIVGLMKSNSDSEIASLVSSFSDKWATYDKEAGECEANKAVIASNLLKISKGTYDTISRYNEGIKTVKDLATFKPDSNPLYTSLSFGSKLEGAVNYIIKYSGNQVVSPSSTLGCGKVLGWFKKAEQCYQILDALSSTATNAARAYLSLYMQIRPNYDSADDEEFKLLMSAYKVTSIVGRKDALDELAETLYLINEQFNLNVPASYKVIIKCPVDVVVYDTDGKIAGKVVSNTVDQTIDDSVQILIGGDNSDEKIIFIEDEDKYSILLTGNDVGSMTIEIENTENGETNTYKYSDIKLAEGKQYSFDISSENIRDNELPLVYDVENGIEQGSGIPVDETTTKHLLTVNSLLEDENGELVATTQGGYFGESYLEAGAELKTLITTNPGYLFEGFYTDENCSSAFEEEVMPEHDLVLYAKFTINTTGITITKHPENADYFIGDSALPLKVEVEEDNGYQYQWYRYNTIKEEAVEIAGADSNSYIPDTNEEGKTYYFVRVSGKQGEEIASLDSDAALITVSVKTILDSGKCGDDMEWSVNVDGKLTITGSGKMYDYSTEQVPWKDELDSITSIEISDGIESISSGAFSGCNNVEELTIPFIGLSRDAQNEDAVLGSVFGTISSGGIVQYYKQEGSSLSGYRYGIPDSLKKIDE